MAYQTRDPLFDAETQAALERRSKELIGLALIGGAVVLGLILGSYSPLDPSFLGSAGGEPQNLLGYPGAYAASALSVILGYGSWALVAALAVWGLRFVAHRGEERLLTRAIFLPLWVAAAAIYAATHPPGPGWTHGFGLGGMFGDLGLGMVIGLLPVGLGLSLKLSALLLALMLVGLGLFVTGFSREEVTATGRFLGVGLILGYDRLMRRVSRGMAEGRAAATEKMQARREARIERRAAAAEAAEAAAFEAPRAERSGWDDEDDLYEDDDDVRAAEDDTPWDDPLFETPEPEPEDDRRPGFLARLPVIGGLAGGRRETVADDYDDEDDDMGWDDADAPHEAAERVQARISGAIKARLRAERANQAKARRQRSEPVLSAEELPGLEPDETDETGAPALFLRPERAPSRRANDTDTSVPPADIPRFLTQKPVVHQPVTTPPKPSTRARAEAQPSLLPEPATEDGYAPPPLALLRDPASVEKHYLSDEALQENARMLETVLDDYGIKGDIVSVRPGPVVTMYELEPAPGLKASRVIGLADDIARSMSALSARVSTVPGRSVIGIELPNEHREMVLLREILSARDFGDSKMRLPLALGKDIGGASVVANLAKMPHLLIAGTTGSGKSVAINTMILSLLYKLGPEECRLIMIDPKMLELSVYDGIPHLLSPVVTDPKKAVVALKWVVGEMEDRYRKMSKMGVRNIEGFNGKVRDALARGEMFERTVQTGFDDETGEPVFETEETKPELLPFIVVIVDEMADLMMVAGKEIEACIQRLAQMARASGIHLIMATQRPSVDVITGTIKANFPTRISFQVTSKVDSRTILGEMGAEQLLGMGDMLYMAGGSKITRVHGPFASDEEVEEVVNHLKAYGPPSYMASVLEGPDEDVSEDIDTVLGLGGNTNSEDALYDQAVAIVIKDRKCSTSYIQRKLGIGYNKAARLVEQMEDQGLVSAANHVGKREILVPEQG